NGYEVIDVYSDKETGGRKDREGIVSMLRFLKRACKTEPHTVIIDDLNRMARDIRVHFDLRDEITAAGAKLVCPLWEFGDSAHDKFTETMLAAGSAYQKDLNAEQAKRRMRARAMDGYYPFRRVWGYTTITRKGKGALLVPDEPMASIIKEALEGYATGRFQLKVEVARFLADQPAFPKTRSGTVTIETVDRLLKRLVYSGMIEVPDWGVTLRKGHHQGLISYETFLKNQKRMEEGARAPARADISNEFPLRGQIVCGSCGGKLTGAYARSKTGKQHGYYNCYQKGCDQFRKGIRKDDVESEFEKLLVSMSPTSSTYKVLKLMLEDLWDDLGRISMQRGHELLGQIRAIEKKVDVLIERLADTESDRVVKACSKKIDELESQRALLTEKAERTGKRRGTFAELYELAYRFLENPIELWHSGQLEWRHKVMKLCFSAPPAYLKNQGFTNPNFSKPFKMLSAFEGSKNINGGGGVRITRVQRYSDSFTKLSN
ncbi:MAG: recombinase family protein, partial [Parvularculaceae bacterium]|nr:recombinase family protein [Parvularculaceae bacterium]